MYISKTTTDSVDIQRQIPDFRPRRARKKVLARDYDNDGPQNN